MRIDWRRPCVALSSGLFQSPSYLLPQYLGAITLTLGLGERSLAWVIPLGYVFPVFVGLLLGAGDWLAAGAAPLVGLLGVEAATLLGWPHDGEGLPVARCRRARLRRGAGRDKRADRALEAMCSGDRTAPGASGF